MTQPIATDQEALADLRRQLADARKRGYRHTAKNLYRDMIELEAKIMEASLPADHVRRRALLRGDHVTYA